MLLRAIKISDLPVIDRIWRKFHSSNFGLTNTSHTVTKGIIEKDGQVLAYGLVKLFGEAIIVLDLDKSKIDKVEALKALLEQAIIDCRKIGLEQLHVFVKDPSFAAILKKHFDFVEVTDIPLVKNL